MNTTTDKLNKLLETKEAIKTAIKAKNVAVADSEPFSIYASKIGEIEQGGGTGESSLDWSAIGYSKEPESLTDGFNYAKQIYNSWDETRTYLTFTDDKNLVYFPLIDTKNVTGLTNTFSGCNLLREIPNINTSKVETMAATFTDCWSLTSVPAFDTSNVVNFGNIFNNCKSLKEIPLIDTSKGIVMSFMFRYCNSLSNIPLFNTSSATEMYAMFDGCESLSTIPAIDMSSVTTVNSMFLNCHKLESLPLLNFSSVEDTGYFLSYSWDSGMIISDIAGFEGLHVNIDVSNCSQLTAESLMNIITKAADLSIESKTATLKFGTTNIEKLTEDQIAIATAKGWTIA